MLKLLVSHEQAGAIIGQAGRTINRLQRTYALTIKLGCPNEEVPGTALRAAVVRGAAWSIRAALFDVAQILYTDHVERGLQGGGHAIYDPFTVRLLIPERAILGVATIEAIACGSGASLRLSRVEAAVCENIILVSGGFEAVLTALVATYDVLAAEQRNLVYVNPGVVYPTYQPADLFRLQQQPQHSTSAPADAGLTQPTLNELASAVCARVAATAFLVSAVRPLQPAPPTTGGYEAASGRFPSRDHTSLQPSYSQEQQLQQRYEQSFMQQQQQWFGQQQQQLATSSSTRNIFEQQQRAFSTPPHLPPPSSSPPPPPPPPLYYSSHAIEQQQRRHDASTGAYLGVAPPSYSSRLSVCVPPPPPPSPPPAEPEQSVWRSRGGDASSSSLLSTSWSYDQRETVIIPPRSEGGVGGETSGAARISIDLLLDRLVASSLFSCADSDQTPLDSTTSASTVAFSGSSTCGSSSSSWSTASSSTPTSAAASVCGDEPWPRCFTTVDGEFEAVARRSSSVDGRIVIPSAQLPHHQYSAGALPSAVFAWGLPVGNTGSGYNSPGRPCHQWDVQA